MNTSLIFIFGLWTYGLLTQGGFGEVHFLLMTALGLVALLVLSIRTKKLELSIFHLLVIGLVTAYIVPVFYTYDREQSINGLSQMVLFIPFSILASNLAPGSKLLAYKGLVWLAAGEVVIGVILSMYRQDRLESTLQYANALAILLFMGGILSILLMIREQGRAFRYSILLAIIVTGLFLTMSRTVWIIWAVAILSLWIIVPVARRLSTSHRISILFSHLAGLIFSMLIKQDSLFFLKRVGTIGPHASEFQIRLVYWKDALRMFINHPIGVGQGGWTLLLPEYRSQSYFVRYIHNHYLQLAVDTGILGLLAFLALIVWWLSSLRSTREGDTVQSGLPVIIAGILFHAGFDFELSLPLFGALLLFFMSGYTRSSITVSNKPIVINNFFIRIVATGLLLTIIYLEIGYVYKAIGSVQLQNNQEEAAIEQLTIAEKCLPWSNTIPYELAKAYVVRGNKTGDKKDYEYALAKVRRALSMTPGSEVYRDLEKELLQ